MTANELTLVKKKHKTHKKLSQGVLSIGRKGTVTVPVPVTVNNGSLVPNH